MRKLVLLLVLTCVHSVTVLAAPCEGDENFWLNRDSLFFGKKKLTDDLNAVILKVPPTCRKLFPTCTWLPQFAKTKRHVFFKDKEIADADPASFTYICDDYARDKNNVYKKDQIFLRHHSLSFSLDEGAELYHYGRKTYSRDGKRIKTKDN